MIMNMYYILCIYTIAIEISAIDKHDARVYVYASVDEVGLWTRAFGQPVSVGRCTSNNKYIFNQHIISYTHYISNYHSGYYQTIHKKCVTPAQIYDITHVHSAHLVMRRTRSSPVPEPRTSAAARMPTCEGADPRGVRYCHYRASGNLDCRA